MEPSLSASPLDIIRWCGEKLQSPSFFTQRLGLPQTEESKGVRGRPQFYGDAAKHCKALYSSWLQTRRDMAAAHFTWKEDLREKGISEYNELSSEFVGPLLDQYGPVLWPESHDVHAGQTISSDYPRRLIYAREPDRRLLTLYFYGWMISCLVPKIPARPDLQGSGQRTGPGSTVPSDHQQDTDNDGAETILTSSHATVPSASAPEHEVAHLVPVAQMLPMRRLDEGTSTSLTNCAAIEALQDSHEDTFGHGTDAAPSEWEEYQPLNARERRIKRRSYSTYTSSPSKNKRQKSSQNGAARSFTTAAKAGTKTGYRRTYDEEVEGSEAGPYPSPPGMDQSMSGDLDNHVNFPNVHELGEAAVEQQQAPESGRITETGGNISLAPATMRQGLQSSSTNTNDASGEQGPLLNKSQRVGHGEDVDPITGEVEPPYPSASAVGRPTNTSARPSLIVPMKLTASAHATDVLRQKLGSKLADMKRTGLSDPNILLLKSTIELLETLSKASHLRLREVYEEKFNHHQEALIHWLQLLRNIIVFYEVTGFKADLSERDAYLEALPEGCPAAVEEALLHGRANLKEWLDNTGTSGTQFAVQVASVFFHMGSWFSFMKPASIERMTTQFTQEMLAWYD